MTVVVLEREATGPSVELTVIQHLPLCADRVERTVLTLPRQLRVTCWSGQEVKACILEPQLSSENEVVGSIELKSTEHPT